MRIKLWAWAVTLFLSVLNFSCQRKGADVDSTLILWAKENYLETRITNWWQAEPDPDYSRASRLISKEGRPLLENYSWTITLPKTDVITSWNINQFLVEFIYAKSFYAFLALKTQLKSHPGNTVAREYQYLIAAAKKYYSYLEKPAPKKWDWQALLTVFPNAEDLFTKIHGHYKEELKQRLGTKQGLFVCAEIDEDTFIITFEAGTAANTRAVLSLESLLNTLGFHDIVTKTAGKNRIMLTITDTAADNPVDESIGFYLVNDEAQNEMTALKLGLPETRDPVLIEQILLEKGIIDENSIVRSVVEGELWNPDSIVGLSILQKKSSLIIRKLESVSIQNDSVTLQPIIIFNLINKDAKRFAALTAENTGRALALVVMDKIIFQAIIQERIDGGAVRVSGIGLDREECKFLVSFMQKLEDK